MMKCSYCGAEYPDDALTCAIDNRPLQRFVETPPPEPKPPKQHFQQAAPIVVRGDWLRDKHPQYIGAGGRWLIFAGLPLAICAILFVTAMTGTGDIRGVSEKYLPYVLFFVPVVVLIAGMVLYDHFPKRLIIPLGIVGWIVHFSVLCWYFWFGPGALGHH